MCTEGIKNPYLCVHILSPFGHVCLRAQPVNLSAAGVWGGGGGGVDGGNFWKLSPWGGGIGVYMHYPA